MEVTELTGDLGVELANPMEDEQAVRLVALLEAMADLNRIRILTALGTACVPVGQIVSAVKLPQPLVSHHLRILRDRGVVRGEKRGVFVFYCVASERVKKFIDAAILAVDPGDLAATAGNRGLV